jgi:hypothetical protein
VSLVHRTLSTEWQCGVAVDTAIHHQDGPEGFAYPFKELTFNIESEDSLKYGFHSAKIIKMLLIIQK